MLLALVLILGLLQYRVWVSYIEMRHLKQRIYSQQEQLNALIARNHSLQAEVESLRKDDDAIEARARKELGLIREGETYFQLLRPTIPNNE